MNDRDYQIFLEDLSHFPIHRIDTEPLDFFLNRERERTIDAIEYRMSRISPKDIDIRGSLLNFGIFRKFDEPRRLSCICICMEASIIRHRRHIKESCEKYREDMPFFKECPDLYQQNRDKELIIYNCIKRDKNSRVFSYKGKFGVVDRRLPMAILNWLDTIYLDKPSFVRLDPYLILEKPVEPIEEAVINAPDPAWWRDLRIYQGKEKGSSYQLLNDPEDRKNYWDYLVKGIRRLEYHAERRLSNGETYLSMMMEELELHEDHAQPSDSYLVGRMIHLDTKAEIGKEFALAPLMHIDLAYNYYYDDKVEKRMSQDLSAGVKVEDATYRTHLVRIENITLSELFPIAYAFFVSKTMLDEWCQYQFMGAEFDVTHRIVGGS